MRNEQKVAKLMKRYEKIRNEREEKIINDLSELILTGVEKILDKNLSVFLIGLKKNIQTHCIDICFELAEYESIVRTIENRDILRIPTDIKYFETTLNFCHKNLADLGVVEEEICSGGYDEEEVYFFMIR